MIRGLRPIVTKGPALTARAVAEAVLAPWCPVCREPLGRHRAGVCLPCWEAVDADRLDGDRLILPGEPGEGGLPVTVVGPYRGALRRIIRCFKFRGSSGLGEPLGERLAVRLGDIPEVDVVVPVPLHWRRRWRRGYNQAALVAAPVGRALGRPVDARGLARRRHTATQSGRGRAGRAVNLQGAFAAAARMHDARVLIVDDVVTTGATLRACARELASAGARDVQAAVVARTLRGGPGRPGPNDETTDGGSTRRESGERHRGI